MEAHNQVPVSGPASSGSKDVGNNKPMLNHPFAWTVFAWILLIVPVAGFFITSGWPWSSVHPAVNAALNASSLFFLCVGVVAIKNRNQNFHKKCMLSAFTASSVFLISYLARTALTGTHTFQGVGILKTLYLAILFSHMVLAVVLVPLCLRLLYLAYKKRFATHRKLARWTFPIWAYVSTTGVVVYFMLYQL